MVNLSLDSVIISAAFFGVILDLGLNSAEIDPVTKLLGYVELPNSICSLIAEFVASY